ncbi:MAG: GNAT family N-acetyltransferase [Chloroflexi bacterium]|nr:GNAT family N-acetyltransferase [Chloroflexota bacterium]
MTTHTDIFLRPITRADEPFLYRLYASTRVDEMAMLDWSEGQKNEFLTMQFGAQHTFYQERFAGAEYDIIQWENKPIGRLYVDRRADEIRIIDIALLPEFRSLGIGSRFMRDILAEGESSGLPVRIHVEHANLALRLYHRLGFKKIGDTGVYVLMEWTPDPNE